MAGLAVVIGIVGATSACASVSTPKHAAGSSSPSDYACTTIFDPDGGPSGTPTTSTACTNQKHQHPITLGPSVSLPPSASYVPRPKLGHYPYAWADSEWDDPIVDGATFTLVHGISPREALNILVPKQKRKTPFESVAAAQRWIQAQPTTGDDYSNDPELVEAGERHGWTMIVENNDYRATHLAVLDRLSRAGAAVVIFNDVEDLSSFQYAVHGTLRREFDPFGGPGPPGSNDAPTIGTRLPQESGLRFTDYQRYLSLAMRLAARLVGFRIVEADLQQGRYDVAVAAIH